MSNEIPAMTHEMGKYWDQPHKDEIEIDDTHALMSAKAFNKLQEYSCSWPTGAYEGKIWLRKERGIAYLVWFGISDNPGMVSNNYRIILVA